MCYVLLLSTTSEEDLTVHNNELVRFSHALPHIAEVHALQYANRWYIGSQAGCSCIFRHLSSVELGFGDPVDWYPEAPEEIDATLRLIHVIRGLVGQGHGVDCIDAWAPQDTCPVAQNQLDVDLASVKDSAFRFFENHHFTFRSSA